MRCRALLVCALLVCALLVLPAAGAGPAAAASSGASGALLPAQPAAVQAGAGATTGNRLFNDSTAPAQAGVTPGAPVAPLYRSGAGGAAGSGTRAATNASSAIPPPRSTQVLGFAQVGEVTSGRWRQDIDLSLISTIVYDSLDVNANGTLSTTDAGYQGWWSSQMTSLMTAAHAAGDRVVLGLTDFSSSSIQSVVGSPAYTQALVGAVVQQVKQRGADGVNVDFEGLTPAVSASDFTAFIAQLRSALRGQVPQQSYLTVDTYGSAYLGGTMMSIPALSPYVDAFDVMEYDITNPCSATAGPNAPLNGYPYSVTQVMNGYLGLVPGSQILLGVPYYGYKWSVTSAVPEAPTKGCAAADPYSGIVSDLSCAEQVTVNWDATFEEPWATWDSPPSGDPCGGNWNSWREMYYDNAQSLSDKYALVSSMGIAGIGIWALGYDSGALWPVIGSSFTVAHGTATADAFSGSRYQPLTPFRILDTRSGSCVNCGSGALGPGGTADIQVAGYTDPGSGQSIPASGVTAVALNVTAIAPTQATYLAVTPGGSSGPATSSLNAAAGQVVANLVVATLSSSGQVQIRNAAGSVDVAADVVGYFTAASGAGGLYHPLAAAVRVCDTRSGHGTPCSGSGSSGDALSAGQPRLVRVVDGSTGIGTGGDAEAVALNLTAVQPTQGTYLAVYPPNPATHACGAPPTVSNLNLPPGATQANRVITDIDPSDGSVCVVDAAGSVNVVMDVDGWFGNGSDSGGLGYHAVTPVRVCDTRSSAGTTACAGHTLGTGASLAVQVAGVGGLPASGVAAVAANLTAVQGTQGTYLRLTADGASSPTSDLNAGPGQTLANLVLVSVASDGKVDILNAQGSVNALIDIEGWFG